MVCEEDWEPRHPQDFVRGVQERSNILPFSYDVDGDIYSTIGAACTLVNSVGVSGTGVAGCARAGVLPTYFDGASGGPAGVYPY